MINDLIPQMVEHYARKDSDLSIAIFGSLRTECACLYVIDEDPESLIAATEAIQKDCSNGLFDEDTASVLVHHLKESFYE